jgi:hypothetical protein
MMMFLWPFCSKVPPWIILCPWMRRWPQSGCWEADLINKAKGLHTEDVEEEQDEEDTCDEQNITSHEAFWMVNQLKQYSLRTNSPELLENVLKCQDIVGKMRWEGGKLKQKSISSYFNTV